MKARIQYFDGQTLQLSAPLLANINDKKTAFGGSIVTLATITGWALTTLLAETVCGPCDVVVTKSSMSYLLPVRSDFYTQCSAPEGELLTRFYRNLKARGRAKLQLPVDVFVGGNIAGDNLVGANLSGNSKAAGFQGSYMASSDSLSSS